MGLLMDLFITFAKIGMFTFGGGYAMIAIIENECVEKKKWITSQELMEVTVIAESTPGPIAINCSTYTGYKKAGLKGAIVATIGMVLPSFLILLLISTYMTDLLNITIINHAFKGIRIAVGILMIQAAVRLYKKSKKHGMIQGWHKFILVGSSLFILASNILGIQISTIYLILVAGFFGICFDAVHHRKGNTR